MKTNLCVSALALLVCLGCKGKGEEATPNNEPSKPETDKPDTKPEQTEPVSSGSLTLKAFTLTSSAGTITMDDSGKLLVGGEPKGELRADGKLMAKGKEVLTLQPDGKVTFPTLQPGVTSKKIMIAEDGSVSIEGKVGITFGKDGTVTIVEGGGEALKFEGPPEARRAAAVLLLSITL